MRTTTYFVACFFNRTKTRTVLNASAILVCSISASGRSMSVSLDEGRKRPHTVEPGFVNCIRRRRGIPLDVLFDRSMGGPSRMPLAWIHSHLPRGERVQLSYKMGRIRYAWECDHTRDTAPDNAVYSFLIDHKGYHGFATTSRKKEEILEPFPAEFIGCSSEYRGR